MTPNETPTDTDLIVSQESLLGELIQQATNAFTYRPFNGQKMSDAAIDGEKSRIRSTFRLKRLLELCYGDPRWMASRQVQQEPVAVQGILPALMYGQKFDANNFLRFIDATVYSIDNQRTDWAKAVVRHSKYARQATQPLHDDLRRLFLTSFPYMRPAVRNGLVESYQSSETAETTQGLIRTLARGRQWREIVEGHLARLKKDPQMARLFAERYWDSISATIPLFGGKMFNPVTSEFTKANNEYTSIRPLSKEEIRALAHTIGNWIDQGRLTLWQDTLSKEGGGELFRSRYEDLIWESLFEGSFGQTLSSMVGVSNQMRLWRRGMPIEDQMQTLIAGLMRWMDRSLVGVSEIK